MSSSRRFLALGIALTVFSAGCDRPPPQSPAPEPTTPSAPTTAPTTSSVALNEDPVWSLDRYVGGLGEGDLLTAGDGFILRVPYAEYNDKLGWLYGITKDGTEAWKLEFTADFDLTVAAGGVAIVSYDHPTDDRWPQPDVVTAIDTATGGTLWEDDRSSFHTVFQQTVYLTTCNGLQDGAPDNCELAARDPLTGEVRWTVPTEASAQVWFNSAQDLGYQAAPDPPFVVLESFPTGYESRRFSTLDPANGQRLAATDEDPHVTFSGADTLIRTTAPSDEDPSNGCTESLQALDVRSGSVRWERTVEVPLEPGGGFCLGLMTHAAGADVLPVLSNGAPQLLDLTSGEPRWTAPQPGRVMAGDDRVVLVGSGDGSGDLVLYDAATGAARWTVPNRYPASTAVIRGDRLILQTSDYCLPSEDECSNAHVHDLTTGAEMFSAPGEYAGSGPDWVATRVSVPGDSSTSRFRLYSTA